MPNYKYGGPVPTAPTDPDAYFFEEVATSPGHSNCYGYAVNYHGHINPGGRCGGTTQIAGSKARADIAAFNKYCGKDGVSSLGLQWPGATYVNKPGGWVAALFTTGGDMHWARLDSQGVWSDKMPGDLPQRSTFQDKNLMPHDITGPKDWMTALVFGGYYWVDAVVAQKKSGKGCIIV